MVSAIANWLRCSDVANVVFKTFSTLSQGLHSLNALLNIGLKRNVSIAKGNRSYLWLES